MEERIVCQKCLYYYVTWEKERPHGCKAYGFKSQLIPSIVVKIVVENLAHFIIQNKDN